MRDSDCVVLCNLYIVVFFVFFVARLELFLFCDEISAPYKYSYYYYYYRCITLFVKRIESSITGVSCSRTAIIKIILLLLLIIIIIISLVAPEGRPGDF